MKDRMYFVLALQTLKQPVLKYISHDNGAAFWLQRIVNLPHIERDDSVRSELGKLVYQAVTHFSVGARYKKGWLANCSAHDDLL